MYGAKEVIVDGYNGILLKNNNRNPIMLSKLLEKAYENRKLLGERARITIEEKYSAKIVANLIQERLHKIYETNRNGNFLFKILQISLTLKGYN